MRVLPSKFPRIFFQPTLGAKGFSYAASASVMSRASPRVETAFGRQRKIRRAREKSFGTQGYAQKDNNNENNKEKLLEV